MKQTSKNVRPNAMAFYGPKGFVSSFTHAKAFAGETGRVATMPDIVAARLASKPGEAPWETWYTTLSAEYLGFSKQGNRILIVAHGIGPMSTLDGVLAAYSHEFNDKERHRRGGRITQQAFRDLEDGKFGEVSIIDFEPYCKRYEYPFHETLRSSQALEDPVLMARLGPQAEAYIEAHAEMARAWHRERAGLDPETKYQKLEIDYSRFTSNQRERHAEDGAEGTSPFIVSLHGAGNCWYTLGERNGGHRPIEEGYAIAHLLSTGRLCHLHHKFNESLVLDVSCHEWWNGIRLVGVQSGECPDIHPGLPDYSDLVQEHRDKLWRSNPKGAKEMTDGFWHLVEMDEAMFTDYPKQGRGLDHDEPEFLVTAITQIGDPRPFRPAHCSYSCFRYGIEEVRSIAPAGSNAYSVGDIEIVSKPGVSTYHLVDITFYKVTVDASQRLIREEDIYRDFDLMMALVD